ncbi:MAG: hypothetical protein IJE53_04630 [Bacilli bacterium]|nr:hypothetical protein [Bacilli bacterium]
MEQDYVEKQVDAKIIEIQQNQNVFDVGTVINVKDFIIEVAGMENVMFYEKINIANKAIGYVVAINEYSINIAVLKISAPINVGDMVYSTNALFKGHFSPSSVGRIIDLFGEDKLNSKKFSDLKEVPIERKTIPIMDRTAVCRPLLTGIAGIDLMYPIGKGQRQLIIGDKRTGKTQIGLDTIVNQNGKNVLCFYVAIGKTKKEVKTIYNELAKRGAISYTTIITAFNDELPPVLSLIPYFALSVAEDYMMEGYDVLVVIDDLKRHAEAYREISLISGKTPGRDAYPADIFYTHSRLLEKGCQHMNGGSITILPIVETKGGDITDYISTNIISITDGQIVLSSKSFQKGEKPAIDYGLSVSRLGGAVQEKSMKAVGTVVRRKLLSYLETRHVYELVNMDEMSTELKNQFMEGKFILDNLNQYKFSARTPEEMRAAFSEIVEDTKAEEQENKQEVVQENVEQVVGVPAVEVPTEVVQTEEQQSVYQEVAQDMSVPVVENYTESVQTDYQEPVYQEVAQDMSVAMNNEVVEEIPQVDNSYQTEEVVQSTENVQDAVGFEPSFEDVAAVNNMELTVQEAAPINSFDQEVVDYNIVNENIVTDIQPEVVEEPVIEVAYDVQPEDIGIVQEPVMETTFEVQPEEAVMVEEPVIEAAYDVQPEDIGMIQEPVMETTFEVQPEEVVVVEEPVMEEAYAVPAEEVVAVEEPVMEEAYAVPAEEVVAVEEPVMEEAYAVPAEEVVAVEEPVMEEAYAVPAEEVVVVEEPVMEEAYAIPAEDAVAVEEPVMEEAYAVPAEEVVAVEESVMEEAYAVPTEEVVESTEEVPITEETVPLMSPIDEDVVGLPTEEEEEVL